jgi:PAS domain S-box-containing protein
MTPANDPFFSDLERVGDLIERGKQAIALERLLVITRRMVEARDRESLLGYLMDQIIELTGAERGFLMLRGDDDAFHFRVAHNLRREEIEAPEFQVSHTIIAEVLRKPRFIRVDNAEADQKYGAADSVEDLQLRSVMVAPLLGADERIQGVAYVDHRVEAARFNDEHETLLRLLADQAVTMLENARLHEEVRRREHRIRTLDEELSRTVSSRTEEQRLTRALQAQIIEQATVSINTYSVDGAVTSWNPGSEALFAISKAQATGSRKFWQSLRSVDTATPPDQIISTTLDVGPLSGEYVIVGPGDTHKHVVMTVTPLRDTLDMPAGVVSIAIDITALRHVEKLLDQRDRLARLGEVAARVAHDFNNSLSVILGHAQVAAVTEDPHTRSEELAIIENAAKDAARTVQQIRAFVRRRPSATPGAVCVEDLIADVLTMTRPRWKESATAAGIRYDIFPSIERDIPSLSGQASQLRNVLINLIVNALDAMPAGGSLEIRARRSESQVCIQVRDTGVGIAAERIEQIFEPFYTTKERSGTGLGLSIAAGIVRGHGGRIEVDSTPEVGTTVSLFLPTAPEDETTPDAAESTT